MPRAGGLCQPLADVFTRVASIIALPNLGEGGSKEQRNLGAWASTDPRARFLTQARHKVEETTEDAVAERTEDAIAKRTEDAVAERTEDAVAGRLPARFGEHKQSEQVFPPPPPPPHWHTCSPLRLTPPL